MTYEQYTALKQAQEEYQKHMTIEHLGDSRIGDHSYSGWTDYYKITNNDTGKSFVANDAMGRSSVEYQALQAYLYDTDRKDLAQFKEDDIECFENAMAEIAKRLQNFEQEYNDIVSSHDSFSYLDTKDNGPAQSQTISAAKAPKLDTNEEMYSWKKIAETLNIKENEDFGAHVVRQERVFGNTLGIHPSSFPDAVIDSYSKQAIRTFFNDAKEFLDKTSIEGITGHSIETLKEWGIVPDSFTDDPYSVQVSVESVNKNVPVYEDENDTPTVETTAFEKFTISDNSSNESPQYTFYQSDWYEVTYTEEEMEIVEQTAKDIMEPEKPQGLKEKIESLSNNESSIGTGQVPEKTSERSDNIEEL